MSDPVEWLEDTLIFHAVVLEPTIFTIVSTVYNDEYTQWMQDYVGNILGPLGIEDEQIIGVSDSHQRLVPDNDILYKLFNDLALRHQLTLRDPIDILKERSAAPKRTYTGFYDYGNTQFTDGLPTTSISNIKIDFVELKAVIDSLYSVNATIVNADVGLPDEAKYIYYYLNDTYGYSPAINTFIYSDGNKYTYDYYSYNSSLNTYDTVIYRDADETTEVTVTITSYVEAYALYDNGTAYVIGDHVMYDDGGGEQAYIALTATTGNPPDPANIGIYWNIADYDNKQTITEVTTVCEEGQVDYTYDEVNELIPAGSESNSYSSSTVNIHYGELTINIPANGLVRYYTVEYYTVDAGITYFWCYEVGEGTYPTLDTTTGLSELEILPIVTLKENGTYFNVDIGSTLYTETTEILKIIGVDGDAMVDKMKENTSDADVTDAFIHFAVDLLDTNDPIVSKFAYYVFDYLFYDTGLLDGSKYIAKIVEGPFNVSMGWSEQFRTVYTGTPLNEGEYSHFFNSADLHVRYQATSTQYIEYVMKNISTLTIIDKGALVSAVGHNPASGPLLMSVPKFFLDELSPIEHMHLYSKSLHLSAYAAQITYLEWYETENFATFLQIVAVVVTVILWFFGVESSGLWDALLEGLKQAAIGLIAGAVLEKILAEVDSPILQAILVVVVILVAMYSSNPEMITDFVNAESLTSTVTDFSYTFINYATQAINVRTELQYEELLRNQAYFSHLLSSRSTELEEKQKEIQTYIETSNIVELTRYNKPAYIEGYDLLMYKAKDIQYDYDVLYNYDSKFDYDLKYRVGLI